MSEWKEYRLEDVAERFAMGPFGSNIKAENFVSKGIPVIRGTNLNFPKYVGGEFVFLSEEKANQLKTSNCFAGDLVLTHRGTLGQVCLVPEGKFDRYVVSQSGMKVSAKKDVLDKYFLFYFLKSSVGQHELLQHEAQVGVPSISNPLTSLKSVKILLPPLLEQRAIAEVLSSLDDKIDLLHRQNKTLEGIAQALWWKMFIENADPGWKKGKLGDICVQRKENQKSHHEAEWEYYVPIDCIRSQSLGLVNCESVDNAKSSIITFDEDDILFGAMRPYFHKVAISPFKGLTRTTCFVIRPKTDIFLPFLLMLVFSKDTVGYADAHSIGSTIPYTVWESGLKEMPIVIPDSTALAYFNQLAFPIINKIKKSFYSINNLQKLRDTLLPKLMSGEVRVKL